MNREIFVVSATLLGVLCAGAFGQERETVSVETLVKVLESSLALSEKTAEVRLRLDEGYPAKDFVRDMAKLQRAFEPSIALIARTNPPPEAQQFAIQIAIGTKEVELALWCYIYAMLSKKRSHLQDADALLKRGVNQLNEARARFESR